MIDPATEQAADRSSDGKSAVPEMALPRPTIRKMRWPYPLIWIVPIVAAVALAIYLHDHSKDDGPTIRILFKDAGGLQTDETVVKYRGVEVGKVSSIRLSDDHHYAVVEVHLRRPAASIATAGALFWIVRPEISVGNIAGLGTLVTGPYIQALPGTGPADLEFTGLEKPPLVPDDQGLWLVLHIDHVQNLQPDSPIFYRGVRVGTVEEVQLAPDSTHVNVHTVIWGRYAPLVHRRTQFWRISGADVKGGVFTGIEVKLDSLQALLTGGIAFATPETDAGPVATEADQFTVHDQPKSEWLSWSPSIAINPASGDRAPRKNPSKEAHSAFDSVMGKK